MRTLVTVAAFAVVGCFTASVAEAACTGSNGRGWGSGNGKGRYEMSVADKTCTIAFVNVINDKANTRIPATQVRLTQQPRNGKASVTGRGIVYTPARGFTGKDTFCTRNTTPKVPGEVLSGCITVTVK